MASLSNKNYKMPYICFFGIADIIKKFLKMQQNPKVETEIIFWGENVFFKFHPFIFMFIATFLTIIFQTHLWLKRSRGLSYKTFYDCNKHWCVVSHNVCHCH